MKSSELWRNEELGEEGEKGPGEGQGGCGSESPHPGSSKVRRKVPPWSLHEGYARLRQNTILQMMERKKTGQGSFWGSEYVFSREGRRDIKVQRVESLIADV